MGQAFLAAHELASKIGHGPRICAIELLEITGIDRRIELCADSHSSRLYFTPPGHQARPLGDPDTLSLIVENRPPPAIIPKDFMRKLRRIYREGLRGQPNVVSRTAFLIRGGDERMFVFGLVFVLVYWKLVELDTDDYERLSRYLRPFCRSKGITEDVLSRLFERPSVLPEQIASLGAYIKILVQEARRMMPESLHRFSEHNVQDSCQRRACRSLRAPEDYSVLQLGRMPGMPSVATLYRRIKRGRLEAKKTSFGYRILADAASALQPASQATQWRSLRDEVVSNGGASKEGLRKKIYRWRRDGLSAGEITERLRQMVSRRGSEGAPR